MRFAATLTTELGKIATTLAVVVKGVGLLILPMNSIRSPFTLACSVPVHPLESAQLAHGPAKRILFIFSSERVRLSPWLGAREGSIPG